jgi:hypothetical protein
MFFAIFDFVEFAEQLLQVWHFLQEIILAVVS